MRKLLAVSTLLAAACGGSSSSGGSTGPTPLAGTVGGRAFSPVEVKALAVGTGSTPCSLTLGTTQVPVGMKAIAIEITSYANACGDFASTECSFHASAQTVTVLVAKLNPASIVNPTPGEPAIGPGTYTINASPATLSGPDGMGQFTVGYAQAIATDATCNGGSPTPAPAVQGGTLRLDQVTGPVVGHVSVTFQGGGALEGDFSAPLCGETPDVCGLATAGALCTVPGTCT